MSAFSKFVVACLALGAGLLLAGCKSKDETPPQSTLASTPQGVMCTKCQTTWVKVPYEQKGRIVSYSSQKAMVCPDCKDEVANFFATGKLQHTCKTCGDSMEICETH